WITEFQAVHISTSRLSRQKKPLAMMPCSPGGRPVVMLAWTGQVTAGKLGTSVARSPFVVSAARLGVSARSRSRRTGMESRTTWEGMADFWNIDAPAASPQLNKWMQKFVCLAGSLGTEVGVTG